MRVLLKRNGDPSDQQVAASRVASRSEQLELISHYRCGLQCRSILTYYPKPRGSGEAKQ